MDTSETYIKMCEKAEEVQNIKGSRKEYRDWSGGDFYSYNNEVNVYEGWAFSEGAIEPDIKTGECVWLPRQDQLQEMVSDLHSPVDLLSAFCCFVFTDFKIAKGSNLIQRRFFSEYILQFTSMEQLWLAYVMKEIYGKVWDGKDWVKEK